MKFKNKEVTVMITTDKDLNEIKLPPVTKVGSLMRNNKWAKRKYEIKSAFVVGSVAKGTAGDDSDIDIAIIIPKVKGKTSLKATEHYHSSFTSNHQMPHFYGRRLDFQFFYEGDATLDSYAKIQLL
jgi:predicted nucleotidyltransferase